MKTFSKPLSSLLALLVSASALVAQPANDSSPTGGVAGGFGVNAALYHKVKVKTTDTYFYAIEAGGGASFASELPSQADNNNSAKPKNPAKQAAIKRDQLVALTIEQYSLLTKKDQYKGSPNVYDLNMEIQNVDFSNTLALASFFQTEEESQLELLQRNLGVDQKITLENIDQFLTEQEANSFHAIQAQLPKGTLYLAPEVKDYSSSSSTNDLQSWYDKTNKYKLAAHFFELEYLNFLVLNRLGVNVLPADERPTYEAFTLDLASYNYSSFHSDDLLNLEEQMISWENKILHSQNAGTETPGTPVTSPANDQPVADQPIVTVSTEDQHDIPTSGTIDNTEENAQSVVTPGTDTTPTPIDSKPKHQKAPKTEVVNNGDSTASVVPVLDSESKNKPQQPIAPYNPGNVPFSSDSVAASADFNQNFEKAVDFPAITKQP